MIDEEVKGFVRTLNYVAAEAARVGKVRLYNRFIAIAQIVDALSEKEIEFIMGVMAEYQDETEKI